MSPQNTHWDALIIGTGIGGGTIGRALAEAGMKVLFVEKGRAGFRAEQSAIDADQQDPFARAMHGLWPDKVHARINGHDQQIFAPLGSTVGGSSAFYAATLERPEPHDLSDAEGRPHPAGGWAKSYAQMEPWFEQAERMYRVHGEADPLSPVTQPILPPLPAPGKADAVIMAALRRGGLHPYQLHAALKNPPGCGNCLGRKCPNPACKMDGRSAGVEPALATGNATLIDRCEVTALLGEAGHITGVAAIRDGEALTLTADRVILSAGALSSPRLLLRSASAHWPDGCANASGLVGRNLMFHFNEMFAVFPGRGAQLAPGEADSKSVGLRDYYFADGQRLGMVQAMGIEASYGSILHYLRQRLDQNMLGRNRLVQEAARLPAGLAVKILGSATVFVGLLEDMPYAENRVIYDPATPGQIKLTYAFAPELLARRKVFRKLISRGFGGLRTVFLGHSPEPNLGHPCGTLRYGTDPATSVLDANCKAHGLDNLWVADASFMPSSMGVNPSLTIAANALHVAQSITKGG